jgi:hypothetical protein
MPKYFQWQGGQATSKLLPTTAEKANRDSKLAASEEATAQKAAQRSQRAEDANFFATTLGIQAPAYARETTSSKSSKEESTFDKLNRNLGVGLMYTGRVGAFSPMGAAGTGVAQTWNAVLAGMGAADYNRRQEHARDKVYSSPIVQAQRDAAEKLRKEDEELFRRVLGL